MLKNKKIAILGATGHIAKGLIYNFSKMGIVNLFLFARSRERLSEFLKNIEKNYYYKKRYFKEFNNGNYDVIINCVGLGTPDEVILAGREVFDFTEKFDNMILEYLRQKPSALYINISSGIVYGDNFSSAACDFAKSSWNINNIKKSDYYGIAKFYSESKHRSLKNLNIVDLRVFGYFSRFININAKYLICEIIRCIKNRNTFVSDNNNIVRDYIHPQDLANLILKCIKKKSINDAFDVVSRRPVTKFEIIKYYEKKYGLKQKIKKILRIDAATGQKNNYYSVSRKYKTIGFTPKYTSLDSIMRETDVILRTNRS